MGSSTSKAIDPEAAVTPVERRSYSRNVFQSSCIRPASGSSDGSEIDDEEVIDDEQVSDHRAKESGIEGNRSNMSTSKSKGKTERNKDVKMKRTDKRASETQLGEWGESSLSGIASRNGSSSSRNRSNRFLSRFSLFPGSISSRSSRAYPESSSSSIISNDDDLHSNRFGNRTKTRQGCELFPSCFLPMSPGPRGHDSDSDSDNSDVSSIHELGNNNNNGVESNGNLFSPRNASGYGGIETRNVDRRNGAREPVEQNVRFSRTLSVGRLRDRVLHRPTFPELAYLNFQPEMEVVTGSEARETGSHLSNENAMVSTTSTYSSSTISNSLYGNQDSEVRNMGPREIRYNSLLEHRSNFLERRRRIRSQVLDEIHQQSVVSSSRPALSSIGSVPAPVEAVEALPVKMYHKLPMHLTEEDAQCYICLVEYEDGDEVRVLPCHHEFHRLCIDKWLKEIHRICPLCRGDICKSGPLTAESSHL
ncbi:Zinc finger, RING/FYVE/PHD-type [Cynara cardunculus var. scolymus]|uniref:Zinc finger, RING/FYVE/PHD-type n=1 Tax=Cynara cardunculus var. scolymus TaxID=59895 RepID=A0A103XIV6_CYNCS|nr:Zinc finger, RING/FYVE/PHD-type [Cynara cardunculus var. scolymus]